MPKVRDLLMDQAAIISTLQSLVKDRDGSPEVANYRELLEQEKARYHKLEEYDLNDELQDKEYRELV